MSGIYLHIPFCKQACNYCNFHFSTSLVYKNDLIAALLKETELQKNYLGDEIVETIYFGGGTPSLCSNEEIHSIIKKINLVFSVHPGAEVTLEANPDDITEEKLTAWQDSGINRLSIGVQSFFDEDLVWMNRAHHAQQAIESLQLALRFFKNISIDLIYGHPLLTDEKLKKNIERIVSLNIPHISCYALTVEPKTPLERMIKEHKKEGVNPDKQAEQFSRIMTSLEEAGYEHYEISNFAKPGQRSRHNSSYWMGNSYLGLGPSAHSYNKKSRQWNITNNNKYIRAVNNNELLFEKEELTLTQQVNEYIMTSLRTKEGLDLKKVGVEEAKTLIKESRKFIETGKLLFKNERLVLTNEGKLLADGIASALFFD